MGAPTVCKVTISRCAVSQEFRGLIRELTVGPHVRVLQAATGHEVAVLVVPDKAAGEEIQRRVEADLPERGQDLIIQMDICDPPPDCPPFTDEAPEEILDDTTRMH